MISVQESVFSVLSALEMKFHPTPQACDSLFACGHPEIGLGGVNTGVGRASA